MTTTNDTDVQAVLAIVEQASTAQTEPTILLPLHTEDTTIVNIVGRRVLGLDALTQAMTAAMASPLADVRTSVEVLDVRFPDSDVAIVSCKKTVHDERDEQARIDDDDSDDFPATSAMTYVMVRTDKGWRIALSQTTPAYV